MIIFSSSCQKLEIFHRYFLWKLEELLQINHTVLCRLPYGWVPRNFYLSELSAPNLLPFNNDISRFPAPAQVPAESLLLGSDTLHLPVCLLCLWGSHVPLCTSSPMATRRVVHFSAWLASYLLWGWSDDFQAPYIHHKKLERSSVSIFK